ncbi:TlpA family protein disulfide reductase [Sphingobacterium olei]|uniref:TlpA family protein disulfide reductase n=1 Tax=Sphingobacterium olei TaxID=2571155 RepID=A0A4U0P7K7_9SPHI|nr:TlpA disulfide reductase family protein [Sphingobacterium olei]TJZ63465.1 TlpA family protein disulfide reductase [Sphingobacterium olei]
MTKKKKISIFIFIILTIVCVVLLWPNSCPFIKQGLTRLGFFKPDVETSVEKTAPTVTEEQVSEYTPVSASFMDSDNKPINTADLKGKVVFINFWATWCPPCRAEMPSIEKLYKKFENNDQIVFLIVEIENDVDGTKKFLSEQKLSLPIFYPNSEIPSAWLGGSIPTTVILDKTGKIAVRKEGMYDYSTKEVEEFIANLINNAS